MAKKIPIKYYYPSRVVDSYIRKELQNLKDGPFETVREENVEDVKPGTRAKAKFDAMDHIFQCFADIICFFEFIREHPILQMRYQKDLRDLFGFNPEPYTSPHHFKNRGGPFHRLLGAILFQHRHSLEEEAEEIEYPDPLHIWLMAVVVQYGVDAQFRALDEDELKIMQLYYDTVRIKTKSLLKAVDLRMKDQWKRRKTRVDYRAIETKAKSIAEENHLQVNNKWALRRAEEEYYQESTKNEASRALGFHPNLISN